MVSETNITKSVSLLSLPIGLTNDLGKVRTRDIFIQTCPLFAFLVRDLTLRGGPSALLFQVKAVVYLFSILAPSGSEFCGFRMCLA